MFFLNHISLFLNFSAILKKSVTEILMYLQNFLISFNGGEKDEFLIFFIASNLVILLFLISKDKLSNNLVKPNL